MRKKCILIMYFITALFGGCKISIHPYPRERNGAYFRGISDAQPTTF